MQYLTLVHNSTRSESHQDGFTSRDLIALTCWMQRSDAHGYRRVLVEGGSAEGGPEESGYVLIYSPGKDWASWGIARDSEGIVIWRCGSGADLGHFDTMLAALEHLPPAISPPAAMARQRPVPGLPRLVSTHGLRAPTQPSDVKPRFSLVYSA